MHTFIPTVPIHPSSRIKWANTNHQPHIHSVRFIIKSLHYLLALASRCKHSPAFHRPDAMNVTAIVLPSAGRPPLLCTLHKWVRAKYVICLHNPPISATTFRLIRSHPSTRSIQRSLKINGPYFILHNRVYGPNHQILFGRFFLRVSISRRTIGRKQRPESIGNICCFEYAYVDHNLKRIIHLFNYAYHMFNTMCFLCVVVWIIIWTMSSICSL